MRDIYVDESSQTKHHFMAIGAVVVPNAFVHELLGRLREARHKNGLRAGELKWTKVSRKHLEGYRAFVDVFIDACREGAVEYHALLVDQRRVDHDTFNAGDPELGFNRFLYHLLKWKVGVPYGEGEKLYVYLDTRNSTRALDELQLVLNRGVAKHHRVPGHAAFERIVWRASDSSRLIQVADVLTGSIAFHKNDHDRAPNASPAKCALATHVAQRMGVIRLGATTPKREKRLTIWNFALQESKSRRRGVPAS